MMVSLTDKRKSAIDPSAPLRTRISSCFIINRNSHISYASGIDKYPGLNFSDLYQKYPMIGFHLENPTVPGAFYTHLPGPNNDYDLHTVFVGPLPANGEVLVAFYDDDLCMANDSTIQTEIFILSLITQAVRAFNQAHNVEDILRLVLIGVTAGTGLGFNRAFIFLTGIDDTECCLVGTHAIGPSSPEEAGAIWHKLSSGELTLEMMFNDALHQKQGETQSIDPLIKGLHISLDRRDNIFAQAALEKKSMIIDGSELSAPEYSDLRWRLGAGPMAVVPLVGNEALQGVLIADNFITKKPITENDLHLLEIFARYASDSIEKFRLNENLEKKIDDLKRANEMIILSRENLVKAERLSVLAEMAGQVAHEVRNPLTVIGGFTKSMLRKMTNDNANYEYLNIIVEQVTRIEQALEKFTSLMNYQKKHDLVCDLHDLVQSTLELRPPDIASCHFDINPGPPIKIKADPDMLRQALLMIINKAGKLNDEKEKIRLTIARIGKNGAIFFEPSGNDQLYAERLYKSFHLGGNLESRRDLAIALEILKYYGGNVGVEAVDNDTVKFYVEMPVYEEGR
jgi:signal transduction histidine kinase